MYANIHSYIPSKRLQFQTFERVQNDSYQPFDLCCFSNEKVLDKQPLNLDSSCIRFKSPASFFE